MCTLTYLPINNSHKIITSNRDESVLRSAAQPPQIFKINENDVVYPKDPIGGGSWIATSNDLTVCLLNGAFAPHKPNPPYRKSRGLIVIDVFNYDSVENFLQKINLDNIEPFTLLIFEQDKISELKWNGVNKSIDYFNSSKANIWASPQLYSEINIEKRKIWFDKYLKNKIFNRDSILQFHMTAGDGDKENDLTMKRSNTVETVSITCIETNLQEKVIYYKDLLQKKDYLLKV